MPGTGSMYICMSVCECELERVCVSDLNESAGGGTPRLMDDITPRTPLQQ